jgi:conjugative transfer pilus assembly protein TraH
MKTLIVLLMTVAPVNAGALDTFFKSLGGQVNGSAPGAFQDQAAGYYTGGGYVMRQTNSAVQPINISLPRLGVGCNNMDLYFGSFSFLKSDQLVALARQIGTGVPSYAFQLALKTMAPQVENLLAQLRKYVQDMNSLMLNSCQASQQIVGGLWPKGTAASEQICMDQKRSGNEDWFGARSHCEDSDKVNQQVEKAQSKYKDLLMGEYNLVWHVLQKMPEYKDNEELATFVMSVTGTLLSMKEDDRYRLKIIEPRADQKEFIGAYLKGGTATQLVCNDEKCLSPKLKQITIDADKGAMKAKVLKKIQDLRTKYIDKSDMTEEELSFLNDSVSLPVYRYIQVSVAAGTHFMMQDAGEFIAAMVLLTQFDRVMSEVIEAVDALQKIQLEDTAIEQFKQNLQQARGRVQALLVGANNGSIMTLNQAIQAIEQAIIAKNS